MDESAIQWLGDGVEPIMKPNGYKYETSKEASCPQNSKNSEYKGSRRSHTVDKFCRAVRLHLEYCSRMLSQSNYERCCVGRHHSYVWNTQFLLIKCEKNGIHFPSKTKSQIKNLAQQQRPKYIRSFELNVFKILIFLKFTLLEMTIFEYFEQFYWKKILPQMINFWLSAVFPTSKFEAR